MKTSVVAVGAAAALAFGPDEVEGFFLPGGLVVQTTSFAAGPSVVHNVGVGPYGATYSCCSFAPGLHGRSCSFPSCSSILMSSRTYGSDCRFGACSVRIQSAFHGAGCEWFNCSRGPAMHVSTSTCPAWVGRVRPGNCSFDTCAGGGRSSLTMMGMGTSGAESTSPAVAALRQRLGESPESVMFNEVMEAIADGYDYSPKRFVNGATASDAGVNEGSCKIFSFGASIGLTVEETLACFGEHYRSVLSDPDGKSHGNIRAFMETGWEGIGFPDGLALAPNV